MIITIDPGMDGAIVGYKAGDVAYRRADTKAGYAPAARQDWDPVAMRQALLGVGDDLGSGRIDLVVIEAPAWHAKGSARMSAGAAGRMGMAHGIWRAICACHGWPYRVTRAQEWRKVAGIVVPKGTDPKMPTATAVAARLPQLDLRPGKCRKDHTGLVDAGGMVLAGMVWVSQRMAV